MSTGADVDGVDTEKRKEDQDVIEVIKFILSAASLVGAFVAFVRQGRVLGLWG